jgi:hypothetical protein
LDGKASGRAAASLYVRVKIACLAQQTRIHDCHVGKTIAT